MSDFYLYRIDSCFLPQIWTTSLTCQDPDLISDLLKQSGAEMHLLIQDASVFERAAEVIQQNPEKINLVLHYDQSIQPPSKDLCNVLLNILRYISSLR